MVDLETLYVVTWSAKQQVVQFGTLADAINGSAEAIGRRHASDWIVVAAGDDFEAMRAEAERWRGLFKAGLLPLANE